MNRAPVREAFLKVIRLNRWQTVVLIFTALGVIAASLVPPQILKIIIDGSLVPGESRGLLGLAIIYMIILLLIGILDFLKEAVLTILGQKITREIRQQMMLKLTRTEAGFFSANDSGAVLSRFTNDVDAINSLFTSGVISMFIDSLKIVGIVLSIWWFSSMLGLLTLVFLPVIYVITRGFQKRMLGAQVANRIQVGAVNNRISETLKNILMIKSFSREKFMEDNYTLDLLDNFRTLENVNFYDAIFSPIIQVVRSVFIALVVVLSCGEPGYLGLTLGMVAASIELISNLFAPIEDLGMELQNIQKAISGIRRVNDFCNESEDVGQDENLTAETIIPDRSAVCLELGDIGFYYEEGRQVLENISLKVNPGEKVAFVGRTGVGKTTLFKLIMGLIRPRQGAVTINGINVCLIPNREKRRIFGYVAQGFHLINGTVADQISLRDEGITRRQIAGALDFVGMLEYVNSLENGLDTPVESAAMFSQGQKQLLAIARAIVANPPILLLDEITANLDSITEDRIVSVLQKASRTHTILSISHRLSSVVVSDTVVILENGRVKRAGAPHILMETDRWYRSQVVLEQLTWGEP